MPPPPRNNPRAPLTVLLLLSLLLQCARSLRVNTYKISPQFCTRLENDKDHLFVSCLGDGTFMIFAVIATPHQIVPLTTRRKVSVKTVPMGHGVPIPVDETVPTVLGVAVPTVPCCSVVFPVIDRYNSSLETNVHASPVQSRWSEPQLRTLFNGNYRKWTDSFAEPPIAEKRPPLELDSRMTVDFGSVGIDGVEVNGRNDIVFGEIEAGSFQGNVLAVAILYAACSRGPVNNGRCPDDAMEVFEWDQIYNVDLLDDFAFPEAPSSVDFDLQTVVLHEMGHVLNMDHVSAATCPSNVMIPSVDRGDSRDTLTDDNVACLNFAFTTTSAPSAAAKLPDAVVVMLAGTAARTASALLFPL